uniref:Uncharacterized protein n=1 Tax=Fagus sylvatica TaxID=28930 RepID=A0A2N9E8M3_FAGSY
MAKILVPSSELCTAGAAGAATNLDDSSLSLSAFLLSLSLTEFSFLSYHRNSLRPPWPNRAPHRRRSSPPLMVEDFGSALPLSLAVVIGESVWVYGLGKTIYGSWVFFEPMWCLMLCEPVCGIQIHSKEAMGFSDLLVGVYGYGRG